MALIFEDESKTIGKKQFIVPDKVVEKLKLNRNLFGNAKKSKGYKRINAIIDDDYNKRSNKKDKIHNGKKTISGSELKKLNQEKDSGQISNSPTDINNVLTGPLFPWAKDQLRAARTAVEKVKAVPPVPKLEKHPEKPEDVNKPLKMGNATIKITENQLLVLKEYHDQLAFNFDEDGNAYFEKNNWEHYVDFLEDIGKPGTLPSSEWGMQEIQNAVDEELEKVDYRDDELNEYDYENAFLELVCETFIYKHNKMDEIFEDNFLEKFNGFYEFEKENNYYDRSQTIEKYLRQQTDVFNDPYNLDNFLTPFGYKEYQGHLQERFTEHFEEYDMLSSMIINDRGLIYIERNIVIPNFNSPEFNLNKNLYKTYYNYLKDKFYDLGNCFSWGEDCGEAYNGSSFGQGKTSELKIKCWVDPKDINWEATVYRNCYSLNYEKEVYIDETGAKIEVFDVVLMKGNANGQNVSGKSLIKTPIIVEY